MIKKSKAPQLITDQTNTPKTGYALTPDELGKLTAFVELLISIDQDNKTPKHTEERKTNARRC